MFIFWDMLIEFSSRRGAFENDRFELPCIFYLNFWRLHLEVLGLS